MARGDGRFGKVGIGCISDQKYLSEMLLVTFFLKPQQNHFAFLFDQRSFDYTNFFKHQSDGCFFVGHFGLIGLWKLAPGGATFVDQTLPKSPVKYLGHSGKGIGFILFKFYIPVKDIDVIVLQNHYDVDSKLHYYFESKIREIVINSSLVK